MSPINATQYYLLQRTVFARARSRPCDNVVQKAVAVIIVVVVVGGGRRGGRYFVVVGVPTCCSRGVRSAFERLARANRVVPPPSRRRTFSARKNPPPTRHRGSSCNPSFSPTLPIYRLFIF